MGDFMHGARNPIRERDERIAALVAGLQEAVTYIDDMTAFDSPGSSGAALAIRLSQLLHGPRIDDAREILEQAQAKGQNPP